MSFFLKYILKLQFVVVFGYFFRFINEFEPLLHHHLHLLKENEPIG